MKLSRKFKTDIQFNLKKICFNFSYHLSGFIWNFVSIQILTFFMKITTPNAFVEVRALLIFVLIIQASNEFHLDLSIIVYLLQLSFINFDLQFYIILVFCFSFSHFHMNFASRWTCGQCTRGPLGQVTYSRKSNWRQRKLWSSGCHCLLCDNCCLKSLQGF